MNQLTEFLESILASNELRKYLTGNKLTLEGIEENILEESYLKFLEQQIQLNARGDVWSNVLKTRYSVLKNLVGSRLLSGTIDNGSNKIFVKILPIHKSVLYYEEI